jgi:hypothetical protein
MISYFGHASAAEADREAVGGHAGEPYFGKPRRSGGSHQVFKMPWAGDPRINLQEDGRDAKPYQVRQLLAAVARLENDDG